MTCIVGQELRNWFVVCTRMLEKDAPDDTREWWKQRYSRAHGAIVKHEQECKECEG